MRVGAGERVLDWGALVALAVHPTKVGIAESLSAIGRPLSASKIQTICGGKVSTGSVLYHPTGRTIDVNSRTGRGSIPSGLQILALIAKDQPSRSLDSYDLRRQLPGRPAVAVITPARPRVQIRRRFLERAAEGRLYGCTVVELWCEHCGDVKTKKLFYTGEVNNGGE